MSEQITVQEAKQLKTDCEKRIAEIVHDFEERTGYHVREIEIEGLYTHVGFTTASHGHGRTDIEIKLITEVK